LNSTLSWKLIAPMWWAFTWRTGLVGLVLSLSFGVFSSRMLEGAMDPEAAQAIASSIMTLVYIPVSLWGFRAALMRKRSIPALRTLACQEN